MWRWLLAAGVALKCLELLATNGLPAAVQRGGPIAAERPREVVVQCESLAAPPEADVRARASGPDLVACTEAESSG